MPWALASAQVMRPFPLSSHRARASTSGLCVGVAAVVGVAVAEVPGASTTMSVDSHSASILSTASASARSMVSPYSRRTCRVRSTYQHWFRSGEPFGNVVGALLVAVDAGRRQREVQEVGCELRPGCWPGRTEAAVVGFGAGDDVLDVCVSLMLSNQVPV